MKAWRCPAAALLFFLLSLAGCPSVTSRPAVDVPPAARAIDHHILYAPTTWSGDVLVNRPLLVTRTATLTLHPGTRVFFDIPEPAAGKDREPWILVMGRLVALGSPEQPIVFSSVQPRQNELDDMLHVREAKEAHFRHCVFERGPWALHLHDTPVDVLSCVFRENYGGVRFHSGKVVVRGSLFENNRIGMRLLRTSPVIEENTFTGNLTGVFFREGVETAVVRRNNFDNQEYDIKLGEAQTARIDASGNWWQALQNGLLGERIYDAADAVGLGRVITDPPLTEPWGPEAEE